VARAAAHLDLIADEALGSMQHFTTALWLGDLLIRLYAAFNISVLARVDEAVARRLWFTLVCSSGAGDWLRRRFIGRPPIGRIGAISPATRARQRASSWQGLGWMSRTGARRKTARPSVTLEGC
jgi:hypothetical protein